MVEETTDDGSANRLLTKAKNMARTVRRIAARPPERILAALNESKVLRQSLAMVVAVNAMGLAPVVQAQASAASDFLCGTGAGQLLGLGLGAATIALGAIAGFRGTMAWNNMGSARTDKKQQGREQLKGAGVTGVGMFFPAMFGVALDRVGVGAFSCINWNTIAGGGAVAVPVVDPSTVMTAITTLPF